MLCKATKSYVRMITLNIILSIFVINKKEILIEIKLSLTKTPT